MKDRVVEWMLHSPRMQWLSDPAIATLVHFWFGLIWVAPGTVITLLWLNSVVSWVSWMSLYALVLAHWVGLQTALADLRVKGHEEQG